jgi:hypothetical protein
MKSVTWGRVFVAFVMSVTASSLALVAMAAPIVTAPGNPNPPLNYFEGGTVRVDFDAALPAGGLPAGVTILSGSGQVISASMVALPAEVDYVSDSFDSDVLVPWPHHLTINFNRTVHAVGLYVIAGSDAQAGDMMLSVGAGSVGRRVRSWRSSAAILTVAVSSPDIAHDPQPVPTRSRSPLVAWSGTG